MQVAYGREIFHLVSPAAYVDIDPLHRRKFSHEFVDKVAGCIQRRVFTGLVVLQCRLIVNCWTSVLNLDLVAKECIVVGGSHMWQARRTLPRLFCSHVDDGFAGHSTARCNHDYAVGTTYSVDSRSGGIFEDRDRLYLTRVKCREVSFHSVHQRQWLLSIDCAASADEEIHVLAARYAGTLQDCKSRKTAGQCYTQIRGRCLLETCRIDAGQGCNNAFLFLLAVGDEHNFIEGSGGFLQDDIDGLLCADYRFLRVEADE